MGRDLFPLSIREPESNLPLDGGFYANPKLASLVFRALLAQPGNRLNALLGQGMEPFDAARLGVYVHGLAGDLARRQVGEVALIATDLLAHLAAAFVHP